MPKAKAKSEPQPKKPTLEALIDELGCVQQRLAAANVDKTRESELKAAILAEFPDLPAAMSKIADGKGFQVVIGPKDNVRQISKAAIIERLGKTQYVQHSSITFTKLEELLGKDDVEKMCVRERTGSRSVKTVARAA
jgi:hypothetical protein